MINLWFLLWLSMLSVVRGAAVVVGSSLVPAPKDEVGKIG